MKKIPRAAKELEDFFSYVNSRARMYLLKNGFKKTKNFQAVILREPKIVILNKNNQSRTLCQIGVSIFESRIFDVVSISFAEFAEKNIYKHKEKTFEQIIEIWRKRFVFASVSEEEIVSCIKNATKKQCDALFE